MSRLLSANFMRVRRSGVFWLCTGFMAGLALIVQFFNYREILQGLSPALESDMFAYVPFVSIVAAVFVSLFSGTEYSDGTIRNKVVIGHSRTAVYLSSLITTAVCAVVMCLIYLAVYSITGLMAVGSFTAGAEVILKQILCSLALAAAFASIFTLMTLLNQNKAVAAVLCVLLAFVLLFSGSYVNNRLREPEFNSSYYMDESGVMQEAEKTKNPRYLEETERKIYEFANDFLPGGQSIQIASGGAAEPWKLTGYSGVILAAVTAAGIRTFKRKDLR